MWGQGQAQVRLLSHSKWLCTWQRHTKLLISRWKPVQKSSMIVQYRTLLMLVSATLRTDWLENRHPKIGKRLQLLPVHSASSICLSYPLPGIPLQRLNQRRLNWAQRLSLWTTYLLSKQEAKTGLSRSQTSLWGFITWHSREK